MEQTKWIAARAAERLLGATRRDVEALCRAGIIEQRGKRELSLEDVQKLGERSRNLYSTGLDGLDWSRPVALLVPLSDPELSPRLELSPSNGLGDVEADLEKGEFVTGWWRISDAMLRDLIRQQSPILGVTGSFVTDVAFIRGVAHTDPITRRRALIVRRASDDEGEALLYGRASRMNQTGTYANLPSHDPSDRNPRTFLLGVDGKARMRSLGA